MTKEKHERTGGEPKEVESSLRPRSPMRWERNDVVVDLKKSERKRWSDQRDGM